MDYYEDLEESEGCWDKFRSKFCLCCSSFYKTLICEAEEPATLDDLYDKKNLQVNPSSVDMSTPAIYPVVPEHSALPGKDSSPRGSMSNLQKGIGQRQSKSTANKPWLGNTG